MATVKESIEHLVGTLVGEGVVDEQFQQLLHLQDESNPHFVADIVEMFLERVVNTRTSHCASVFCPS